MRSPGYAVLQRDAERLIIHVSNVCAIDMETIVFQMSYHPPKTYCSLTTWGLSYKCDFTENGSKICYHLLGSINNMIRIKYNKDNIPISILYMQRNSDKDKYKYNFKRYNLPDTRELYMNVYIQRTFFMWLPTDVCRIIQAMINAN